MTEQPEIMAEIGALEQEVQEKLARLAALCRSTERQAVADYTLLGPDRCEARLSELFGPHEDLIVVHNMGRSCPYCTLWADGFNGVVDHLQSRAAFVVVSSDTPEEQQAFARERGWRFRMLSAIDSSFTADMGFDASVDGERMLWPGFSTFQRRSDGSIVRVASGAFGPGDPFCAVWHLFAHLADGPGPWRPRQSY